jgi:hypothetical protein
MTEPIDSRSVRCHVTARLISGPENCFIGQGGFTDFVVNQEEIDSSELRRGGRNL